MMQPQALCHQQKFQLLEILYMRLPNGERVRPGTKAVLYLLADCRQSLHWSNARIAEHLGYSLRTICRAMVELRETGILSSFRKRRETAQKYLNVSKAVDLVGTARRIAKQNCAIALAAIRRGLEVPRMSFSDHWGLLKGKTMGDERLKLPEVAQRSDATKQLLEALRQKDAQQPRLFGQSGAKMPKPAEVSDLTPQMRRLMLGK